MLTRLSGPHLIMGFLLASMATALPVWSLTLEDVMIDPSEVDKVCQSIPGEHGVSMQARIQYRMLMNDSASASALEILNGKPVNKMLQSFQCGDVKSTLYYYEYASKEELAANIAGTKTYLWGESGPTQMHPELILDVDNVLVVVSSKQPGLFANILAHRLEFPDLPDSELDKRMDRLDCGSKKARSPEACSALKDFRDGGLPSSASSETLLLGRSYEISEDSKPGMIQTEALFVGRSSDGKTVASFGPLAPDNDDEKRQISSQLEAQKEGKVADTAKPLIDFMRAGFGKSKAGARSAGGKSLAFLSMGNRIYVRSKGTRLILVTNLMHQVKKEPYVVAVFETGKALPAAP